MRFYCIEHQQDVYTGANHVGRVTCQQGLDWHHIGHNFPAEPYWEHCLGCTAIWFYKQEDFPRDKCPACKRELTLSHLCHNCETLGYRLASVYAPDTPAAVIDASCGSCGTELADARWHFCLTLGRSYLTARDACPYCNAGFFPATSGDLASALTIGDQYQRMRLASLKDDRPLLVASSSKNASAALFSLLAGSRDAIVLPRVATREKIVQNARVYRRVFDWRDDWAGDLIIERPAIFEREENKWRLKEIGTLAGRVADNGAAVKGSTVSVSAESLPPVAEETLNAVGAEPPIVVAVESPTPPVIEYPPALPAAENPEGETVAEESDDMNVIGTIDVTDPTTSVDVVPTTQAAPNVVHDHEVAPQQQEIIQVPEPSLNQHIPHLDDETNDETVERRDVEVGRERDGVEATGQSLKDPHRHHYIPGHLNVLGVVIVITGIIAVLAFWLSGKSTIAVINKNSAPTPVVSPQPEAETSVTPSPTPSPIPTPVALENMRYFPPGNFTAGRDDGTEFERPAHTHNIKKGFYIDIKEITCRQYEAYLSTRPDAPAPAGWRGRMCPTGQEELPVTGVDWYGARAYAESKGMRLPTEMEWEYAARWNTGFLYPWGNEWRPAAVNAGRSQRYIAPADSYHEGATASGLLHMSGNVWEWTSSDFTAYEGGELPHSSRARGIVDIGGKVIRGGAWNSGPQHATTTYRMGYLPRGAGDYRNTGFRCAKDAQQQ